MAEARPDLVDSLIRLHAGALPGPERAKLSERAAHEPEIRATLAGWARQDDHLRAAYAGVLDAPLPQALRDSIAAARRDERLRLRARLARPLRVAAMLVLLALGVLAGFVVGRQSALHSPAGNVARDAIAAYATYAADGLPPVERPLTDRAAITAWLSDRLGLPVAPPGLTKAGLHLTGARVLPSENGPAAFLLYEDSAGHRIALTIGRTGMDTDDTAFRFAGHDGVETIAWTDGGLTFTVTGQTGQDALRRIAAAVYAQMD